MKALTPTNKYILFGMLVISLGMSKSWLQGTSDISEGGQTELASSSDEGTFDLEYTKVNSDITGSLDDDDLLEANSTTETDDNVKVKVRTKTKKTKTKKFENGKFVTEDGPKEKMLVLKVTEADFCKGCIN